jgi:parallel beta-helix repeat protein
VGNVFWNEDSDVLIDHCTVMRSSAWTLYDIRPGWTPACIAYEAQAVTFTNNTVCYNYGEGLTVVKGSNITMTGNIVHDNMHANIYLDNAYFVLVDDNLVYTGSDKTWWMTDDGPTSGIMIADEGYKGCTECPIGGSRTITNNTVIGCWPNFHFWWRKMVGPFGTYDDSGMINDVVSNNIFVCSQHEEIPIGVLIENHPEQDNHWNTVFEDNKIYQYEGYPHMIDDTVGLTFINNEFYKDCNYQ